MKHLGRSRWTRRILVMGASVALLVGALAAPALAGNTRDVYIGDPGGTADANGFGFLDYTLTVPGGLTAVDIEVRNDGGQTLNHANLYGGYAADSAPVNPLFPAPVPPSLPDGLTYAAAFPPAGVTCAIGPDASGNADRSLACDLGTFAAGTSKTVRVVVRTPGASPEGGWPTWYGVWLSEGNQTGTNQDNFYATGSITTAAASCSGTNADANYFLPGSKITLSSADCGTGTKGSLSSRNALIGQGGFGSVEITGPITDCPAGYTCYGDGILTDVLDGASVPGGLQWDVTWYGTNKIAGVIHLWDTYEAGVSTNGNGYDVIPFTKKFQCSAKLTTNCWVTTAASKATAVPLWFKATFITPNNGRGGGFI